jgi:hypothetical protein
MYSGSRSALLQGGQYRFQIQHGDRVGIVRRRAQSLQDELQAIRVAVAADFPLMQFQLVQDGFQLRRCNPFPGHCFDDAEHQRFQRVGGGRLTALNTAAEDHFALRVLKPAQGRGCLTESGGFQSVHEW